jgi:hypothetical protein
MACSPSISRSSTRPRQSRGAHDDLCRAHYTAFDAGQGEAAFLDDRQAAFGDDLGVDIHLPTAVVIGDVDNKDPLHYADLWRGQADRAVVGEGVTEIVHRLCEVVIEVLDVGAALVEQWVRFREYFGDGHARLPLFSGLHRPGVRGRS